MEKQKRYPVPPKMNKSKRYGGFEEKDFWVLATMFGIIVMIVFLSRVAWTLYLFAIPVVYGIMVYRFADDYNGATFFKDFIHYMWTPQTYVLTPRRKESDEYDE